MVVTNLVSNQKAFALGFFSPGNSNLRYVGIWYNEITEQTVVWVANRDNPLNDTSGVLSINGQGNLVLHKQNQTFPIWSTNVSVSISSSNNSKAQLLDSGNLVLVQQDNQRVIWQSFDYPTNTLLPFMKLGLEKRTGLNRYLTSWKSKDDPGTGNASFRIDPTGFRQFVLYMGRTQRWWAGPWNGLRLSGVPKMTKNFIFNVRIVERSTWHGSKWVEFWSDPKETCDNYLKCGPNSYCDPYNAVKFECTCLPGFEPKLPRDWYLRDGSGGCVRKPGVFTCNSGEGFVKLARMKVPDTSVARANMSLSLKECEKECLRNCSCMAYTSADVSMGGIGCLTWHRDLVDTRSYSNEGQDLYIRVDAVVLAMRQSMYSYSAATSSYNENSTSRTELDGTRRNSDLPLFDLSTIVASTDNFSFANKLGEGGFGYTASQELKLLENQLTAIKRAEERKTCKRQESDRSGHRFGAGLGGSDAFWPARAWCWVTLRGLHPQDSRRTPVHDEVLICHWLKRQWKTFTLRETLRKQVKGLEADLQKKDDLLSSQDDTRRFYVGGFEHISENEDEEDEVQSKEHAVTPFDVQSTSPSGDQSGDPAVSLMDG
uniref:Bulb-type lectin domain-containing protein n=1 Tax=Fagus sylvatica TaxID=28930 RepID=A0A2N9HI47_FAGSY